jgi:hypothetical protein
MALREGPLRSYGQGLDKTGISGGLVTVFGLRTMTTRHFRLAFRFRNPMSRWTVRFLCP